MDVADYFWLREREEISVVQKTLGRVPESLPSDIRFLHAVRADGRAHRSIDDGNSTFEDFF